MDRFCMTQLFFPLSGHREQWGQLSWYFFGRVQANPINKLNARRKIFLKSCCSCWEAKMGHVANLKRKWLSWRSPFRKETFPWRCFGGMWEYLFVWYMWIIWLHLTELWIIKFFFIEVLFQILCSQTNSCSYGLSMLLLNSAQMLPSFIFFSFSIVLLWHLVELANVKPLIVSYNSRRYIF